VATFDPDVANIVQIFNPRAQRWAEHFELHGAAIVGRTPVGRATVAILRLNDEGRLLDRQALIEAGRYPPPHFG
jgi:hypothetical protein